MKNIYNRLLILIMLFLDAIYIVNAFQTASYERIPTYFALPIVLFIPFLIEKLTKKKLNANLKGVYYSFIFLADFLGCVVGLYNSTMWFDKLTHFLSGVFTAFLGLLLMEYFQYQDTWLGRIFCALGFTCLIAVVWEFFEYGMDSFFKTSLQHADVTGVQDTMQDIIAAFIGASLLLMIDSLDKKKGLHHFIQNCKIENK